MFEIAADIFKAICLIITFVSQISRRGTLPHPIKQAPVSIVELKIR